MKIVFRGLVVLIVGFGIAIGVLWVIGPREEVETAIAFDPATLPDDLDAWLAETEARVPDLRPESRKRIVWAETPGARTDLVIVYLHGFSADPWETRPVADEVAEALGANLFYQRLAGHGRDGPAMAEPSAGDWIEDMAEAMAIGRRIGHRVVVIGTSTGGTLAALLAAEPGMVGPREDLAGIAFVSPNFDLVNPVAFLLAWPAARYWLPLLAGETRSFEPHNAEHAEHWTTTYPTVATLPMKALVDHAGQLDWRGATVPALFYFSPLDDVVDPAATEAVAAAWGGPARIERAEPMPGDDPSNHVIAGDILSPARTPAAVALLTEWMRGL